MSHISGDSLNIHPIRFPPLKYPIRIKFCGGGVPTQTAAKKDPGPLSPEIPKKTGVACKVCVRQIARKRYRAGLIRHPVGENVAINRRIASVLRPKHQPNTVFDKGIESCPDEPLVPRLVLLVRGTRLSPPPFYGRRPRESRGYMLGLSSCPPPGSCRCGAIRISQNALPV
jgi:hypothetical protein